MTMIACTINRFAPIVIADILISQKDKPNSFNIPVLQEDVLQYLSGINEHPISLDQKIYILKHNVCIAFAGTVGYFKDFLEDISIFCRVTDNITIRKIEDFLNDYATEEIWQNFSFLILVVETQNDCNLISRLHHGNWKQ